MRDFCVYKNLSSLRADINCFLETFGPEPFIDSAQWKVFAAHFYHRYFNNAIHICLSNREVSMCPLLTRDTFLGILRIKRWIIIEERRDNPQKELQVNFSETDPDVVSLMSEPRYIPGELPNEEIDAIRQGSMPMKSGLKMISCFKKLTADNQIAGGLGQGGGGYWQEDVGIRLQNEVAKYLKADLVLSDRQHGKDSFDRRDYWPSVLYPDCDIAYCQLFEVPHRRPAKWIYSIISDYLHMEELLEDFLQRAKPNVIISFQYPLVAPPGRSNLVAQCEAHGCKVVFLPWFNSDNMPIHNPDKDVVAMCTGKIGGTYPMRDEIYHFLEKLGRSDVILSGNPHGSTFRLNDDEYRDALGRCRYYVTGGIYDIQIPPKYYEVCNFGATLVSPELPMMAEAGFVDGETYIKINGVEDIPAILDSQRWTEIGWLGQKMVHERHSLKTRAADIGDLYLNEQDGDNA